jgi:hypothetical protein
VCNVCMYVSDAQVCPQYHQHHRDPLAPSYTHHGDTISDPASMHHVPLYHARPGPFLSLTTSDIEGARPSVSADNRVGGTVISQRRDFLVSNNTADILGAQPGTHRSGLPERSVLTDPNARDYLLLDGTRSSQVSQAQERDAVCVCSRTLSHSPPSQVYARTGVGQSAYMAAVDGLAASTSSRDDTAAVQLRRNVDPRDVEIQRLRRQLEQQASGRSGAAASGRAAEDPFLAIAAERLATGSQPQPQPPLPQAGSSSSSAGGGGATDTAATSRSASSSGVMFQQQQQQQQQATAAPPRSSAPVAASASSAPPPLSPRNQSADFDDADVSPTKLWPLSDRNAPKAMGRGNKRSSAAQAGASITSIATGHADSSSAAPVKFSQMSKAMIMKKALGPGILSMKGGSGGGGGASFAANVGARLSSMTRASDIVAVRSLPA